MLLRSTTASIRRGTSGFVRPPATERVSAPAPNPGRFRPPSPALAALSCASALLARIEFFCPTHVFIVPSFAILRMLLCPRPTFYGTFIHHTISYTLLH